MSEQTTDRSRRKVRTGVVVSDGMDKTVMVRIDRQVRHARYDKTVRRSTKLAAHDEACRRLDTFMRTLSREGTTDLAGLALAVRQLRSLAE